MAIVQKVKDYLEARKVTYEVLLHPQVFTASEVAQALHVPGKELAKVVILKVDERFVMTVLPANWKVDLHRLKEVFHTSYVRLASEEQLAGLFPDCDLGTMPPFGNLYGIEVYVDQSLTVDETIVFQAGTHSEAIKMRYEDFAALVHPSVTEFHQSPSKLSSNPG